MAALELILRAQRVIDRTGAYHLTQSNRIPVYFDPRHDRQDRWSWVRGTTCPKFHQDLTQVSILEAIAVRDGLDELYAHILTTALFPGRSTPVTSSDTTTPADLYRLITASPEVRLLSLVSTYLRATDGGLLKSSP